MSGAPALALDHLVIGAATLAQGVAWCRQALGVEPAGGGKHAFMATHNRVVSIADARFPQAYLEIIAVDPLAAAPGRTRWFDLDRPDVRDALDAGPRLLHWVARCSDIDATAAALREHGCDPGPVVAAERDTPHGLLRWRLTVPADGWRPGGGAVPALIAWGEGGHPTDRLPPSGLALTRLALAAARLGGVAPVLAGAGPAAFEIDHGSAAAPLAVTLATPRGPVTLESLVLAP